MTINPLPYDFSICKINNIENIDLSKPFTFFAKTDEENSLVCQTKDMPDDTMAREDDWKAFRFEGVLDFSLVGILAEISGLLAKNNISIFAISTYNTDYILVKSNQFQKTKALLKSAKYKVL